MMRFSKRRSTCCFYRGETQQMFEHPKFEVFDQQHLPKTLSIASFFLQLSRCKKVGLKKN